MLLYVLALAFYRFVTLWKPFRKLSTSLSKSTKKPPKHVPQTSPTIVQKYPPTLPKPAKNIPEKLKHLSLFKEEL